MGKGSKAGIWNRCFSRDSDGSNSSKGNNFLNVGYLLIIIKSSTMFNSPLLIFLFLSIFTSKEFEY